GPVRAVGPTPPARRDEPGRTPPAPPRLPESSLSRHRHSRGSRARTGSAPAPTGGLLRARCSRAHSTAPPAGPAGPAAAPPPPGCPPPTPPAGTSGTAG